MMMNKIQSALIIIQISLLLYVPCENTNIFISMVCWIYSYIIYELIMLIVNKPSIITWMLGEK
jgi:hypothetical protein